MVLILSPTTTNRDLIVKSLYHQVMLTCSPSAWHPLKLLSLRLKVKIFHTGENSMIIFTIETPENHS